MAGAREAFLNGVPAISVSYDWYVDTTGLILVLLVEQYSFVHKLMLNLMVFCFCQNFLQLPYILF